MPSDDETRADNVISGLSSESPPSTTPPSSYVYPVRSLLFGVQPVRQDITPSRAMSHNHEQEFSPTVRQQPNDASGARLPSRSSSSGYFPLIKDAHSGIRVEAGVDTSRPKQRSKLGNRSLEAHSESGNAEATDITKGPGRELIMADSSSDVCDPYKDPGLGKVENENRRRKSSAIVFSADRDWDEHNPRRTEPLSSIGADSLAEALYEPNESSASSLPFNLSQTGIVHLPPIPSPSRFSDRYPATSSGMSESSSTKQYRHPETSSLSQLSLDANSSQSKASNESSEHLVTFRYEDVEDENGFHVVVGREGKLTRCEDEPIHAPGAVQGFGVLIAVQDDGETGNLVVRQVSENAAELLGLSARYLFSLDCFTQTLPDSQADLLWDNVQFLQESDPDNYDNSESNDIPQVFLLSGWGEPGSANTEEEEEGSPHAMEDRRFWTCWCAAHRPPSKKLSGPQSTSESSSSLYGTRSLIILEFELERDLFNPLYPPFSPEMELSGRSPATNMSADGGSRSSGGMSASTSTTAVTSHSDNFSTGNATTTQVTLNQTSTQATAFAVGTRSVPIDMPNSPSPSSSAAVVLNPAELFLSAKQSLAGNNQWFPSAEEVFESTTSQAKPLKALERMRRASRIPESSESRSNARQSRSAKVHARRYGGGRAGIGTMDIFAVLAQINDQLSSAPDLSTFLKVVVGVVKDLTQFHRVLVYQFDEQWNGQVVAELVDWRHTHDLYKGLHFPASDIPAQARELYKINKVRLLYDRSQTTARLVVRSKEDLENPLDMTHSYLRAMSPIHLKYLGNMGVRSSMSISVVTFGGLWGLISCHSYGLSGMRVSFPVRQMLRLLSDSISRNVERLSYAQRLHTRKLISTLPTDAHPTGYIVSNAEDLLGLFDADFGVLVIGEGAKIFGPNQRGQEILIIAEYLRLKQFTLMQVSQSIRTDFPDLLLPSALDIIAGLLYVPLSSGGKDFIALLRKGQLRDVKWAGKPYKDGEEAGSVLEPRKSFKIWKERIAGRCRVWTDEQMETAGVLALVYGKFIEVWRQKESVLQTTQLTNLLLSNASHEVRTPLNHIINYLEMALNGPLDSETRDNLIRSHTASKSLLFTINDLLDLTKLESGKETSFNEPFDLQAAIEDALQLYRNEAIRRNIDFKLDISESPRMVVGDSKKIRTVVANLTANAVKYTTEGTITVSCHKFREPLGLRDEKQIAVEIVVGDSGCGIESTKLESIFRQFEQVEYSAPKSDNLPGLGLGLAVVARIVEQLGGQLRVDSKPGQGSRFSFLIPFTLYNEGDSEQLISPQSSNHSPSRFLSRTNSNGSGRSSEIDSIVEALGSDHIVHDVQMAGLKSPAGQSPEKIPVHSPRSGKYSIRDSKYPIRAVKVDEFELDEAIKAAQVAQFPFSRSGPVAHSGATSSYAPAKLRVLIVEDDQINRTILTKRLTLDGHLVIGSTNGQEGVEKIETDREFDCVLMDIQMPILNGFEATERIRTLERAAPYHSSDVPARRSKQLNGRIPIFAVSASLHERQRDEMLGLGMDGWILKPIDFRRLKTILKGILDPNQREQDVYHPGCSWEAGGWLSEPRSSLFYQPQSPSK